MVFGPYFPLFTFYFHLCVSISKWAHQDSNLGQAGYEPAALTAEL